MQVFLFFAGWLIIMAMTVYWCAVPAFWAPALWHQSHPACMSVTDMSHCSLCPSTMPLNKLCVRTHLGSMVDSAKCMVSLNMFGEHLLILVIHFRCLPRTQGIALDVVPCMRNCSPPQDAVLAGKWNPSDT